MAIPKAIQEEIKKFEHTKAVFMNTARLLKKSEFPGSEAGQVAECLALMEYMTKETSQTIDQIIETSKKAQEATATPAPTVDDPKKVSLAPHMPE